MKRWMMLAVWGVASAVVPAAVMAQERIYRCGNEYTNSAVQVKQRNCQVIDGGHVTVVHTGNGSASSTPTPPKSKGSEAKPATSNPRAVQVDPGQQKARDNDARSILQAELQKAQDKLRTLQLEFNDGHPNKTALELRNPQVFGERLEALKASIARQESDVVGIQRELSRHTGG